MHLDDRLPDLLEITDSNRQQRRRIESTRTDCTKCGQPVVADDLCFADGKDAHRSCAEMWNFQVIDAWQTLMEQDAEADPMWTPPDLSAVLSSAE